MTIDLNNDVDSAAPTDPVFSGFLAVDDINYGMFANFSMKMHNPFSPL